MHRRLTIPLLVIGGLIVLGNHFSLAVAMYFGLAILFGRAVYMLARKAGRNRIFGLFLWSRVLDECEDYSELPEEAIAGVGKINGLLYCFGVSVDEKGIFVRNLSSAMKRKIHVPWDGMESVEVWRSGEFATEHARVTLKAGRNFKEIILPWRVECSDSVPSSLRVSRLEIECTTSPGDDLQ